ncbi:uncharacterized protein LOC144135527 [Amblyomma americanum]
MSIMKVRLPQATLLLLLLAPSICLCLHANPRSRREVHKRARPPGGDGGGWPITALQSVESAVNSGGRKAKVNASSSSSSHKQRLHLLDVGKLMQVVLSSQSNNGSNRTGGSSSKQQQPVRSRHIDASMAELVAVQTLQGDVTWIELKFVNDSQGTGPRRHRHRTRPYSLEERLALIVPVVFFVLPFLVWLTCMVTCIARASAKSAY